MTTIGDTYYLVGKPCSIKQAFISHLQHFTQTTDQIIIPNVFTTHPGLVNESAYTYLEERIFKMRDSMGLYCLSWKKNGFDYAVGADIQQWLTKGKQVFINGSMLNVDKAQKVFPDTQVIVVRNDMRTFGQSRERYVFIDEGDVRLEWISEVNGIHSPYVISVEDHYALERASKLLLRMLGAEKQQYLKKTG